MVRGSNCFLLKLVQVFRTVTWYFIVGDNSNPSCTRERERERERVGE
jgi:hypothetical protein